MNILKKEDYMTFAKEGLVTHETIKEEQTDMEFTEKNYA